MSNPVLTLLLDDEPTVRELLCEDLAAHGFEVVACGTCEKAGQLLREKPFQAILLDYSLPDGTGAEFFRSIRSELANVPVLFITSHANVDQAVLLMKEGAADYILKPFSAADVASRMRRAIEVTTLRAEVGYHRRRLSSKGHKYELVGNSAAMQQVRHAISEVVRSPATPVLVTGETGTGKEIVARLIHEGTHGDSQPFVEVDCTTIPKELFESELFGHERGAFTGADRVKEGIFELGKEGSIFLDEIGEIELALQSRLLRALETRQFRRVGGTRPLTFGARVIAATNRDLQWLMNENKFRSDLYFRLAVYQVCIPPLRDRPEDVRDLAEYFLREASARHGKKIEKFSESFLGKIANHSFPGNVRELRNLVEQAVIQTTGAEADCSDRIPLVHHVSASPVPTASATPPATAPAAEGPAFSDGSHTLLDCEREAVEKALRDSNGNKSAAARQLGISRPAFMRLLARLKRQ